MYLFVVGDLALIAPLFFKKLFLMGTPSHTHTRSHLYTLVLTYFSQIKLALRVLNFYSDVTSLKEG